MTRRKFVQVAIAAAAAGLAQPLARTAEPAAPSAARLPRWRGFNLLEKFTDARNAPFRESDFELIAEWGFDFVRLPLSYHCWAKPGDWLKLDENILKQIDAAVEYGRKHRVHVNINFHRAPGYCVNPPKEPLDLWTDPVAQEASIFHWKHFARRYKGIPNTQVSFDLLNEPDDMPEQTYAPVARRLVEGIREVDPDRLIIADGLRWGQKPVHALADLGIAQSTRGYAPTRISHYKASWIHGQEDWKEPTWPLTIKADDVWDKARLFRENIEPWKELERKGVGVHVGEWGAYSYTPHSVALAWMQDCLDLWKEAGWGWALWNFRGPFGILNSNRTDVEYESFRGMKLDRKMLDLIRAG